MGIDLAETGETTNITTKTGFTSRRLISRTSHKRETSQAQLKAIFLDCLNVILESLCFRFGGIGQPFQKGLYGNNQNDCTGPEPQRPRFQKTDRFLVGMV